VLLLDIDYFKAVNDSYGHDAGDSVLREFAARVRRNIRGIDLACRLGG
jgi:two-component system cell cycle response regulator